MNLQNHTGLLIRAIATEAKVLQYRGYSIEQERDGSYSVYRFGYVSGHHKSIEVAKKDIDWRRD